MFVHWYPPLATSLRYRGKATLCRRQTKGGWRRWSSKGSWGQARTYLRWAASHRLKHPRSLLTSGTTRRCKVCKCSTLLCLAAGGGGLSLLTSVSVQHITEAIPAGGCRSLVINPCTGTHQTLAPGAWSPSAPSLGPQVHGHQHYVGPQYGGQIRARPLTGQPHPITPALERHVEASPLPHHSALQAHPQRPPPRPMHRRH